MPQNGEPAPSTNSPMPQPTQTPTIRMRTQSGRNIGWSVSRNFFMRHAMGARAALTRGGPRGSLGRASRRRAMSDDPYAALGVAKTATQDEIRKAYKKIAKRATRTSTPATEGGGGFKAASAAHDLLKDPEKRRRFDARRDRRQRAGAAGAAVLPRVRRGAGGDLSHQPRLRGLRRLLRRLRRPVRPAGARRRAAGEGIRMRGGDAHYTLTVGFLEAARGATRRITMPDGSVLDVKIPQGLADGQTIRLRGKGGAGIGGARSRRRARHRHRRAARLLRARGRRHPGRAADHASTRRCSAARSRCRRSTAAWR